MKYVLAVVTLFVFLIGEIAIAEEAFNHPLIKTDLKSLVERRAKEFNLLRATPSYGTKTLPQGRVNLLPFVSTKGQIRDQKECGNCWVWTGLASLEVFKNYQDGIAEASDESGFSVGFVNSFFHDGGRSGFFACEGGTFPEFVSFFSAKGEANQKIIPWSNANAEFADEDGGVEYMGTRVSHRTKNEISINPYFALSNISLREFNVYYLSDKEMIEAIKETLNQGVPIALGMYMTGVNDWSDFNRFWVYGTSNEIFDAGNRTSVYNERYMAGHAVLIIGYDDTSSNPNDHHWIALNSWGNPAGHSDGTFKLKMNTDYHSKIVDSYGEWSYKMFWYRIDPVFSSQDPLIENANLSGRLIDPLGSGVKDVAVKLNDKEVTLTDENGYFSFSTASTRNYKLNFIRHGYKFNPSVYMGTIMQSSDYAEIKVENDPAYNGCKGNEINPKGVASNGTALYNLAKSAANKLKDKTTQLKSLDNTWKSYLSAYNTYPRISYSCPSTCQCTSFSPYKTQLRNAINKLTNLAQGNWKKCLTQKKAKANVVTAKKKTIQLKRCLALKQLQKLPAQGDICN